MVANPLIGYAFLKVSFNEGSADILDLTLPLVRRALHQWRRAEINPEALQKRVEEVWGMIIPQYVLRTLLGKLNALNVVYFDAQAKVYRLKGTDSFFLNIIEKEKEAQGIYGRVISSINAELLREGVDSKTGRSVIEDFLDKSSISFISSDFFPGKLTKEEELSARVIARIIGIESGTINHEFLNDLEYLIIGDLLYKAIQAISEGDSFDQVSARMTGVKVFLDTGVIFRVLGYFGDGFQKPAEEMVEILKATGCDLCTFEHTVDEVAEGLRAVSTRLYSGGAFGPIMKFVLQNGISRVDLLEAAANVPREIEKYGVKILNVPERTVELNINETALDWQIETDVKQNNPIARRRDVDSLAGIYRLRNGKPQNKLENCSAVLVTTNRTLADASNKYFRSLFLEEGKKNIVQLCMTDVVLTTRLWLKVPTKFESIPRNQILAHAQSSLRPSLEVITKFLKIIRERVVNQKLTPALAIDISFSDIVKALLVLETDNDYRRLNDEVVDNLVAQGIRDTRANIERIRTEATSLGSREASAAAQENIKELEKSLNDAKSLAGSLQEEREAEKQVVNSLTLQIEMLRTNRIISELLTRWTIRIGIPMIWVGIVCGIVVPVLTAIEPKLADFWRLQLLSSLVAVFLGVLTIFGIGYKDFRKKLDEWVLLGWEHVLNYLLDSMKDSNIRREPRI